MSRRNKNFGSFIINILIAIFFVIFAVKKLLPKKMSSNKNKIIAKQVEYNNDFSNWPPEIKKGDETIEFEENLMKKNYYIVFDGSGSMKTRGKLQQAKDAIKAFVMNIPKDSNIGLLAFDRYGITQRSSLGESRERLIQGINGISALGTTPLKTSIEKAYKKIIEQGNKQLGYGEYNLVIVTDGEASANEDPGDIVNKILEESPVSIHTIGFQIEGNHSLNQQGRITYKSANNLDELKQGLQEVLAEIEDFSVQDFE